MHLPLAPIPKLSLYMSKAWILVATSLFALLLISLVGKCSSSSHSAHHITKYVPEFKKFFFQKPVHIPYCIASYHPKTTVGYSTVIIQLKDKFGKLFSGTPPDIEFKLTLTPQTIPDFHDPVPEVIPGGYKISYYATVASHRVGAGVPPEYSHEGKTVYYTLSVTEKDSGKHIEGSPFKDAIFISPGKSPAMPQKSNTDLPKVLDAKNVMLAGNPIKFHIFARDSFGESTVWSNLLETDQGEFKVSIVHLDSGREIASNFGTPDGGIHPVEFTPILAGKYNISVTLKSASDWVPIGGNVGEPNPFTVEIFHGSSTASLTTTTLPEQLVAKAGEAVTFFINGKDAHENAILLPNAYNVVIEDEALNTKDPCEPLTANFSSLLASCIFTKVIPESSPKIKVFTSSGELVASSNVEVHHGKVNVKSTQLEGVELIKTGTISETSGDSQWRLLTKTGINSSVFVNLYDEFSNKVMHGGHVIEYDIQQGLSHTDDISVDVLDLNNGTYEIIFLSKSPNNVTIKLALNDEFFSFGGQTFLSWIIEPDSDAYIKSIFPSAGPTTGKTIVTIFTSTLYRHSHASCWFISNSPEYMVPAVISDDLESIQCTSPPHSVHGIVTIGFNLKTASAELSATWNSFFYYDKHAIPSKVDPTWVDTKGEAISVEAENIVETGVISCRFSSTSCTSITEPVTVPAKALPQGNAVTCQSPALPSPCTLMVDISLNSQQYKGEPLPLHFLDDSLPVAPSLSLTTQEEKLLSVDLSTNLKVVHGVASLSITEDPPNGVLELKGSILNYTPKKRFFGQDRFVYGVTDERNRQVKGEVNILVQRSMAGPSLSFPPQVLLNFSTFNSVNLGKRFEGIRVADPALYFPLSDGTKLKLSVLLEISNGTFEIPRSLKNTIVLHSQKKDEIHSVSFEADLQMTNLVISHIHYRPKVINGIPVSTSDSMFVQIREVGPRSSLRQMLSAQYNVPITYILPLRLRIGSWIYSYSLDIFAVLFFVFAISFVVQQSSRTKKREEIENRLHTNWTQIQASSKQRKQVRSFA